MNNETDATPLHDPDDLFRTAIVFEGGLGVLALFLGWLIGPDPRALIPIAGLETLPILGKNVLWGIATAIPMLLFVEGIQRVDCKSVQELHRLSQEGVIRSLMKLSPLELVLISLCAGVGEELFFRGWFFHFIAELGFLKDLGSTGMNISISALLGLVFSSLLFGLVHPLTKLYFILATLIGLYLGAVMMWTNSLVVPIVCHAFYDAFQLIRTKYWPSNRDASAARL
jgi:uncharacterized protein